MPAKSKLRTFYLSYRGTVNVDYLVEAATLEIAIAKGREVRDSDVLAKFESLNDVDLDLVGAYTPVDA